VELSTPYNAILSTNRTSNQTQLNAKNDKSTFVDSSFFPYYSHRRTDATSNLTNQKGVIRGFLNLFVAAVVDGRSAQDVESTSSFGVADTHSKSLALELVV